MKTTLKIFALTALCVTLICTPHSFAQNFVDGQMPDTFLNVGSEVFDIKFSPDGTMLASGNNDNTISLWNPTTGEHIRKLDGHSAAVRSIAFSSVRSIAFSPDGTMLASGNLDSTISLWNPTTGEHIRKLDEHWAAVSCIAFSPDGTMLASGSSDSTVKLWDVATGTLKDTLKEHRGPVLSVAFSPDGTMLASGSSDSTVKLWDVATGTLKTTLKGPNRRTWLADYADRAKSYDEYTVDSHVGFAFSCVTFSSDGTTIVSGGWEYISITFKTLDSDKRGAVTEILLEIQINNHDNQRLRVIPSGDRSTSRNDWVLEAKEGFIDLWDVASGTLKATWKGHEDRVTSVALSPDDRSLASGSWDRTVKLWDVTRQPKAPKATLSYHGGSVNSVTFSPDGKLIASGSYDGAVRLWTALPSANGDGVVNIADLIEVTQNFGQVGENDADINGDGVVNIIDLILVAVALGEVAGAPAAHAEAFSMLTAAEVEQWLIEAKQLQTADPNYLRGILVLEQLLAILTPKKTVLLPNYPNPFNPETWIPYQLAKPADVKLTIYDINGHVVRALDLGHQRAGIYQSRSRAAHWDGRNEQGEPVASGVYFYTLKAGDFTATRKMLIRK